jgi:hypothetical protein
VFYIHSSFPKTPFAFRFFVQLTLCEFAEIEVQRPGWVAFSSSKNNWCCRADDRIIVTISYGDSWCFIKWLWMELLRFREIAIKIYSDDSTWYWRYWYWCVSKEWYMWCGKNHPMTPFHMCLICSPKLINFLGICIQ